MWINIKGESYLQPNRIYVEYSEEKNKGILKFPKCKIETIAYVGKNGLTKEKKEGDGKTPIGEFKLGIILGKYPKEQVNTKLEYKQITENMYWVDDIESEYYNQLVDTSLVIKKDWNTAEHLIDYPIQYEYLIEIKTNPSNIRGKGSAIFLHCTNNRATAGCIAIDKQIMKELIENIDKQTKIVIKYKQYK